MSGMGKLSCQLSAVSCQLNLRKVSAVNVQLRFHDSRHLTGARGKTQTTQMNTDQNFGFWGRGYGIRVYPYDQRSSACTIKCDGKVR